MKKYILFFTLFFAVSVQAISFKENLLNGNKGDFIVFEYNNLYSALSVFDIDKTNKKIILEEVTVPKNKFNKQQTFKQWLKNGAHDNTSWTMYEIDLDENKIENAFSFSKKAWINLTKNESLIMGLLNLQLKPIAPSERKKIGPPPKEEPDKRPLWNPIKIFNSKKIPNPNFKVYKSFWPNDGSVFSSKIFEIYFDSFTFPYFIEIKKGQTSYIIKAIDSGDSLISKINQFPRHDPEFIQIKKTDKNLILTLKEASHFNNFNLFAIDVTKKKKEIIQMDFETLKKKSNLSFILKNKNLKLKLKKEHKYRWLAIPKEQNNLYIESKDIFIWK